MSTRTCHFCGATVTEECPACTAGFPLRPAPETMTADEREAEMRSIGGPCEVQFPLMHARIEQLVGRPVWTHEMGTSNFDNLCREARWEGRPATMDEVLAVIPEGKRVIVVPGVSQP